MPSLWGCQWISDRWSWIIGLTNLSMLLRGQTQPVRLARLSMAFATLSAKSPLLAHSLLPLTRIPSGVCHVSPLSQENNTSTLSPLSFAICAACSSTSSSFFSLTVHVLLTEPMARTLTRRLRFVVGNTALSLHLEQRPTSLTPKIPKGGAPQQFDFLVVFISLSSRCP